MALSRAIRAAIRNQVAARMAASSDRQRARIAQRAYRLAVTAQVSLTPVHLVEALGRIRATAPTLANEIAALLKAAGYTGSPL